MSAAPNANAARTANAYLKTRVLTATPEELRMMLLDGALKFARQGRDGLAQRNYEQSFLGLSQCRDIVIELMSTIKDQPNPELAAQVRAVYGFLYQTLVQAGHAKDLAGIDKAIQLLEYERETWALLMQKLAEERQAETAAAHQA